VTRVYSFPPVTTADTRVLILGSMPGEKSLQMQQYYAHPQNTLWKIMGELIGAGRDLDYAERIMRLNAHGIGMWDVLMSCHRPGSLDSAIVHATMEPNNFDAFYLAHAKVTHVFFNGGKAAETYKRYVLPRLSQDYAYLQYERLPSTSPAHASLNFQQKLDAWRKILNSID
jgi:TDG/mug DNA glycosylase family protein